MEPRDPTSATRFAFDRLTDDEWEELTFLLAHRENEQVIRLQAPDGGLDTALPSDQRPAEAQRGWQAKHYPRAISWVKCEKSLDRAVKVWNAPRVTFVFPRDLTRDQHATFQRRLAGRHQGVDVDYWGAGAVSSRLLADERGERIARRFFGMGDPVAVMERAMRAGGELSRGEHVLDRGFALQEFLQGADPHFTWVLVGLEGGEREPPRSPGAILRLRFSRGEHVMLADAVARSIGSLTHYGPKVRLIIGDSPEGEDVRRLLAHLFADGGRLRLRDGQQLAIDRMPRPFQALFDRPLTGEVLIKAVQEPAPLYARLEAATDLGQAVLDIDLMGADPPDDWDVSFVGSRGGLEMKVLSRWSVDEGMGETSLSLRYRPALHRSPLREGAAAAQLLVALHGKGDFRLVDRADDHVTVEQPLDRRPLDSDTADMARLLSALVEIERSSGLSAPDVPEEVERADIDVLADVAEILRAGGVPERFRDVRMTVGSKTATELRRAGSDLELRETAVVHALDREIAFAERVVRLPLMRVVQAKRLDGPKDLWELRLVSAAADVIEVFVEFRPLPEERRELERQLRAEEGRS